MGSMPKIDERIVAIKTKLKQLKVLQQRKEARARTTATKRTRHEELRRTILVGAVLLAKVEAKEFEEAVLKRCMDCKTTPPRQVRRQIAFCRRL
jgi:hypothetical protein